MWLKEIELIGFKSFADKTKLRFAPGITGIVGPNGCGKSNISDAFRWVFGEQSAKSLRGNKMPDVIFAGTTTRKPVNFAEVTITFSDIQGALPIDYEEVAITRRLHRNGESEYFINRHPVRLKDIQGLFLDSGMGKDAYSIFEQGKIDQIINYSSLERRYIFEEAAGILRFLQRKREALRRLEQADLNVSRVKDIHHEVERQIAVLERQAEEAKVYKENQERLSAFEKGLLLAKWENVQQRRADNLKREEECHKALEVQKAKLEALKEELKVAKAQLIDQEMALRVRSEEVYRTQGEKEIKSREKLSHQERLKEAMAKEKRWLQELQAIVDRREARQSDYQTLKRQQKAMEGDLAGVEVVLNDLREAFQQKESEVSSLRARTQAGQQERLQLVQKENHWSHLLKTALIRFETTQQQQAQAEERQSRFLEQERELEQSLDEKQKRLQESAEEGDRLRVHFADLEQKLQTIVKALEREQATLDQRVHERAESRARQKALFRLREEKEGFSAGAKRLLQEASHSGSPLYQKLEPLCEKLTLMEGGELALAASLRPYSQTLLVRSWADFDQVVAFAKELQLQDYALLCLEGLSPKKRGQKLPKGLQPLISEVSSEPLAQEFFTSLFAAKERDTALEWLAEKGGGQIWLEEGALIDSHQVFFYYAAGSKQESNAFLREAELKALEQRLKELEADCLERERALQQLQKERSGVFAERVEQDKAIRRAEMKQVEINFAFQRAQADGQRVQQEIKKLQSDLQAFGGTLHTLTQEITSSEQQHKAAKGATAEAESRLAAVEAELESQVGGLKREQQVLRERESAFHKLSDDNRRALHALHVHEVKDLESAQQEKRLEEEIKASRELQNQMVAKTGEQELLLKEVEVLLAKVMAATADQEREVGRKRGAVEESENRLQTQGMQVKKREEEQHQIALQRAQFETVEQGLVRDLQERHETSFEILKEAGIAAVKGLEQAEKEIRALRHKLEAAGAINMTAIEECSKQKERYTFLSQQMDDLALSKKELVEIIAQLDAESRKQFLETFEQIRANFKKNFALLFQGGEADLQFTDTADVLEAGIDIIAQPPAKQMRSIQLLSGGEKCLTAMALLFAIFEVKPSPFCILDEIDAPLDDANVERFVRVVKQFVERTQFLIITHNKRTMAIADRLFGVSMEEKGVSKILSMEFAHQQPVPQLV